MRKKKWIEQALKKCQKRFNKNKVTLLVQKNRSLFRDKRRVQKFAAMNAGQGSFIKTGKRT
jgi:hypothetical protein